MRIEALGGDSGHLSFEEWCSANSIELVARERPQLDADDSSRWYVHGDHAEVSEGHCLVGTFGDGPTPDKARAAYARKLRGRRLVINAYRPDRREIQCPNQWADVPAASDNPPKENA